MQVKCGNKTHNLGDICRQAWPKARALQNARRYISGIRRHAASDVLKIVFDPAEKPVGMTFWAAGMAAITGGENNLNIDNRATNGAAPKSSRPL